MADTAPTPTSANNAAIDLSQAYLLLKPIKRRFVDAFVKGLNQTDAAREVWPTAKRPDVKASKLMAEPIVRAAIAQRTREVAQASGIEATHILRELAAIGLTPNEELGEKLKPTDKLRALEMLGKHLALWKERMEHSGPGGGPIPLGHSGSIETMSAEEAMRAYQEMATGSR